MSFIRHPRGPELGAWFDGEDIADVGAHVAGCGRCTRRVSEMARVRAWIRAQPFFAMGDTEPSAPARLRSWRPRAVAVSLLLVLGLLVANAPRLRGPEGSRAAQGRQPEGPLLNAGAEGQARAPAPAEPDNPGQSAPTATKRQGGTTSGQGRQPLRLGLVVPTRGPAAAEGSEVVTTVRRSIEVANARGGVGGQPVELVVAPAEDQAAVAALAKRVSALVGGFGAAPPAGVPWLFPADPSLSGPGVVPAEAPPEAAGQRVGELLRGKDLGGPVGVVVGAGPERALAAGLASKVPTTTVAAASDDSCASELASLRRAGAVALAVAGSPDLAVQCLRAVAGARWAPRFGTVVAPSAAYAGLNDVAEARGSRTVLGLPWPTSSTAGAARFRAAEGNRSYRALVSFAATELAIEVARQKGAVSMPAVAGGTWRSDLFEVGGLSIRTDVVVMGPEGWTPSLDGLGLVPIPLPPLPPVLVIP
ncbi:MAG: ABC transporter substrate-binding protein [Actinomycetota bacterium]|nr:ABC transporter substrate-binding protein [Actinomycetota bacterium]MDQ3681277.1 ABC transporter substrate-binding protein [Actinomycetota bacterium]